MLRYIKCSPSPLNLPTKKSSEHFSKKVTTHPWSTPQAIPLRNYERIPFTTYWSRFRGVVQRCVETTLEFFYQGLCSLKSFDRWYLHQGPDRMGPTRLTMDPPMFLLHKTAAPGTPKREGLYLRIDGSELRCLPGKIQKISHDL